MRLERLIHELEEIYDKEGDLLVFAVIGSTGSSYSLGFPDVVEADLSEQGDTLDLKVGEKYVSVYAGN